MPETGLLVRTVALAAAFWAPATAAAQDADTGFSLFQTEYECASCHGDAAEGAMGPTLAGTRLPLDAVRRQVRSPRSRRMPAFSADEMPERDLEAIYAYLRGLEAPTLADKETWWNQELLNLPTPALPAHRDFEVHFGHRFSDSVSDAGFERLYGLDSFAFPGFWFSYGLTERIAPYAGRTANLATWEYGVKIGLILEGQLGIPIAVAANVGRTYLGADGVPNAGRFTAEVPIGIRASDRLAFQVVPMYATNTDEFDGEDSSGYSTAVGFGGSFRLNTRVSVDGEYVVNVGGFKRAAAINQWQAGITMHVRKHWFSLLISNSTYTTPDFMVGGSVATGVKSNVRLGFNIVRAFNF